MPSLSIPKTHIPGPVKTVIKLVILAVIVFLVIRKIDERLLIDTLRNIHPSGVLWALAWYALSKIIAAFRFNTLLRTEAIVLPARQNLKLYWLCMYYNLLLPGGISGDGYKIKILMDRFGRSLKTLLAITLTDRVSGLFALVQIALLLALCIPATRSYWYLIVIVLPLTLPAGYLVYRWAGGNLKTAFGRNTLQSLAVQGAQVVAVAGMVVALGQGGHWAGYLALFLTSSVVAMLPITIGGAGARELTFLYGAQFLDIQQERAVAIAFLFYMVATAVSFSGIVFSFRKVFASEASPNTGH